MKQIKFVLCIVVCIPMIFSCSCGFFGDQRYICTSENVQSIQIVSLDKYVEGEYRYEYTVLCEIGDISKFVKELNSLEQSVNWGDPLQLDIGYVVIRIEYTNGDYDLLYNNAQWFNHSGVNQAGFFFFDEKQFNTLISNYYIAE